MIVAAVPVKDLINAKQRLVPALGAAERAALAAAMLQDVLAALAAARLDRVWVVTREPAVLALARARGAEPLAEDANRGHTAAVARAQAESTRRAISPRSSPRRAPPSARGSSPRGGPAAACEWPACRGRRDRALRGHRRRGHR